MTFDTQGFVGPRMVFQGKLIGVLLAGAPGTRVPRGIDRDSSGLRPS